MKNQQNKSRIGTDRLFRAGGAAYTGFIDRTIRLIEDAQLKNRELWHLLAVQYRGTPDTDDCGWRGEYWGKLMRGAVMIYQYTKDEELYAILEETTRELLSYQDEYGRFSTYSLEGELRGWDIWGRRYILYGFLQFHEICRDEELKEKLISALERHLDYIVERVGAGKLSITDTSEFFQGINSSSILEPVIQMYLLLGKQEYLDFARHIVENGGASECNIFELAYEGKLAPYEYPVRKACELMSCFEGLIEYYRVTKEEKWRIATENFVKKVIETDITIIGCAGCEHELFDHSVVTQTVSEYVGVMQETCVTVTWMLLCYQMLCLTGDAAYADQIETTFYNVLLGSVNTENATCSATAFFGMDWFRDLYIDYIKTHDNRKQVVDSYSPLKKGCRGGGIGGFRALNDNKDYFGCCMSIVSSGVGLMPQISMMQNKDAIAILFYADGVYEANCTGNPVRIRLTTAYPADGVLNLEFLEDTKKSLMLRIPSFSETVKLECCGKEIPAEIQNGFVTIDGDWKKGDCIRFVLDMNPQIIYGVTSEYLAVTYGPLVLARDARIAKVGETVAVTEGCLSLTPSDTADFDTICEFEVQIDHQKFRMIDYASAGKTWDEASEMEAWLPSKKQ